MLYQITNGTVSLGGHVILSHIDFHIKSSEKIGIIGKNGAGKTTLLHLLLGKLGLDRDDKRQQEGMYCSRNLTVGILEQHILEECLCCTIQEEMERGCPYDESSFQERVNYFYEFDRLFLELGFQKEEKKKQLAQCSGGQQRKVLLIQALLQKPDILLLDEPTNHLDLEAAEWLERYLKSYERAIVVVSHDRFFMDQFCEVVYELSQGKLKRYVGNYTAYRYQKKKEAQIQYRKYQHQQEEINRLNEIIDRFKHKPSKSAFIRSKRKVIERMEKVEKPEQIGSQLLKEPLIPEKKGNKWVLEAKDLKIGYGEVLKDISLRMKRGQKIGILGANGVGKTTFLKTVAGRLPKISGECILGDQMEIGYFDQQPLELKRDQTVLAYFHEHVPNLTQKEARSYLASYLFYGEMVHHMVESLSGGEKARLSLAVMLNQLPNFLILDEPTNHMDIEAKERIEAACLSYQGSILFVSHDRYFIKEIANAVLVFEQDQVYYYPFGYEHYRERKEMVQKEGGIVGQIEAKQQALIADLRAVPKGERHRLKEISTGEAYFDWENKCLLEQLEYWREQVEIFHEQMEYLEFLECEKEDYLEAKATYETVWQQWHEKCLEWYGWYEEYGGESRIE